MPIDPGIILAQRPVEMPDVAKMQGEALAIQEGQARARDRVQAARDKQIQAQQADQLQQVLASSQTTDPVTGITTWDRAKIAPFLAHMPPAVSKQVLDLMDQSDEQVTKAQAHQMDVLKTSARMVQATGSDATVFLAELDRLVKNHQVSENSAAPIIDAVKRDPAHAGSIVEAILGGKPGEGQATLNQGDIRVDPTGKVIASNPKPAEHSPIYKEWQDAVSAGYKGSFQQYENEDANRKKPVTTINNGVLAGGPDTYSSQRPDPATANKRDPRTGLTPNAIYNDAIMYSLTGTIPAGSRSMATLPGQNALRNTSAAMVQDAGVSPADLRNEYAGIKAATRNLMNRYTFSAASAEAAKNNLQLASELSGSVPRGGAPVANRFSQWLTAELGGKTLPNLSAFETAIYSAAREYAKVTSGGSASVAGLTDSGSAAVEKLLNAAQTPKQFQAVADVMVKDMDNFIQPMANQIGTADDVGPSVKRFLEFLGGRPIGGGGGSQNVTVTRGPDGRLIIKRGGGE